MTQFHLEPAADRRLDEIYDYTRDHWGKDQAARYMRELFARFESIARRETMWRPIPLGLGIQGHYCRHGHHFIYWKQRPDDSIAIVSILHESMQQTERLRDDVGA